VASGPTGDDARWSARLEALEREYAECERLLADPDVIAERDRHVSLSRRYSELLPVVELVRRRAALLGDADAGAELLDSATGEEQDALRADLERAATELAAVEDELRTAMLPRDPNDDRAVLVELRGAEGGEEANLFARDLLEMYRGFAARRGWSFEVLSSQPSDLGGVSEAILRVAGAGAWSQLKFEAGPHRVQRVPVTESQGRVHTSSATVAVLPEADEVEVDIDPADLDVDVFRASGPGGQSVNTTDSAVRITHRPSGLVVSMQDEKSQLQNRAKAMRVLRARLLQLEQQRRSDEESGARRAQIGGGGRSEKVRTYNFKENRVSDHRIGLTVYHLDRVLAGELDEISDALVADERARALAGPAT
jgi:peptide chain release factor 1